MNRISVNNPLFTDLNYWLIDRQNVPMSFNCKIMSAVTALYILRHTDRQEVKIIESVQHSVVFDGLDTWDTQIGIVLRDYEYPKLPGPQKLDWIPALERVHRVEDGPVKKIRSHYWEDYYSLESIVRAKKFKPNTYTVVKE